MAYTEQLRPAPPGAVAAFQRYWQPAFRPPPVRGARAHMPKEVISSRDIKGFSLLVFLFSPLWW